MERMGIEPQAITTELRKGFIPESYHRSLCIVLDGKVHVRNPYDDYCLAELSMGNHFGASDLIRGVDIDYYGDVYSGPYGVKLLVIEKPDQIIQLFERRNLQESLKDNWTTLSFVVESRYGFEAPLFNKY